MDNREYILRYFELHAKQRMSSFNFYILLSSIIGSGIVSSFTKDFPYPELRMPIGLLLFVISFVFWKLDQRVRMLLHIAEKQLRAIEIQTSDPNPIFSYEEKQTHYLRKKVSRLNMFSFPLKYSECFGVVFITFGLIGLGLFMVAFFATI